MCETGQGVTPVLQIENAPESTPPVSFFWRLGCSPLLTPPSNFEPKAAQTVRNYNKILTFLRVSLSLRSFSIQEEHEGRTR